MASGLGRGLSSLIPPKKSSPVTSKQTEETPKVFTAPPSLKKGEEKVVTIPVEKIQPNPHQPRRHFSETSLKELAVSIKAHGILQPLIVTKQDGYYQLIAGERRLKAAKMAGQKVVPVIVREAETQKKLELALVENLQRDNLNSIEEAYAYKKLAEEFFLKQEEIAKKVGKDRATVANTMRLLDLPKEMQRAIQEGKISAGHGKAILSIKNPLKQQALYQAILQKNLTVRGAEDLGKTIAVKKHYRKIGGLDPEIKNIQEKLEGYLGTKVRVEKDAKGGRIAIEFYSKEELQDIAKKLLEK